MATGSISLLVAPIPRQTASAFSTTTPNPASSFTADLWFGIASVSAGLEHTCAAKYDGTAWCWGKNDKGQLGDNTQNDRDAPVEVVGSGGIGTLTDAILVTTGGQHTCAALDGEEVWCWGNNGSGQLGDNTTSDSESPVESQL